MSRTLKEKLEYNERRKGTFSTGYRLGVKMYQEYPKGNSETKRITQDIISTSKELAQAGDEYSKGFMCGMRDAANERKKRAAKTKSNRLDF